MAHLLRLIILVSLLSATSVHAKKEQLIFSDSRGAKFTFFNFKEKAEKSLGAKIAEPRFIVVYTPNGQDPKYLKQNKIIDSIEDRFIEENTIIVIVGCAKLCVLSGYKIENPSPDLTTAFQIQVFDASGKVFVSSKDPLNRKSLLEIVKKNERKN